VAWITSPGRSVSNDALHGLRDLHRHGVVVVQVVPLLRPDVSRPDVIVHRAVIICAPTWV
jgi:hypothetical protein